MEDCVNEDARLPLMTNLQKEKMREIRRKQKEEEEMKEIKEHRKKERKNEEGGLKCLVKHIASDPKGMKTDIKNLLALIGV